MIFWTGGGIVAAIIWAVCLAATQRIVDFSFERDFYRDNMWPKILGSTISAPIIWFVGRKFNGSPRSAEREQLGAYHTLFWIPMEYWGPIFIVLGVIVAVVHHFQQG